MKDDLINVSHIIPRSAVNGPGERFVIWVQGCPLHCKGCWNPETWSFQKNNLMSVDSIYRMIQETPGIEGVTFTGGEPFAQAEGLARLACILKAKGLSVMIFTGYEMEELKGRAGKLLLSQADVVVAGRFVQDLLVDSLTWRGSSNQEVHFFSPRYSPKELETQPQFEFHLSPTHSVSVTGFPSAEFLGVI